MISDKDHEELCKLMGITLSGFNAANVKEIMKCGSEKRIPQKNERNYHEKLRVQAKIMAGDLEEYRRL